jgi:hypothetical protein
MKSLSMDMAKQIIFEDEQIRVIFLQGSSDELIFSFGDLITRAKGTSINAEKSLAKFGFNVVGIMPKQKSWFPESSMLAMLDAIRAWIAPFKPVLPMQGQWAVMPRLNTLNCLVLSAWWPWCRSIRLTLNR